MYLDEEKQILLSRNSTKRKSEIAAPNFKSILPQCFATFVASLSFILLGIFINVSTVVIGDLMDKNDSLSLDIEQASWFSSMLLSAQPLGCLTGGFLQSFIGRKRGLILMNLFAILSSLLLARVSSVFILYVSSVLMGITVGLLETPGLTYVTEISEPRLRGTFLAYVNFSVSIGTVLTFLLNSITDWRTLAVICIALSVITFGLLVIIPESPYWLMNKGREKEALKALCWLRGHVPKEDVEAEFESIRSYTETTYLTDAESSSSDHEFHIRYLLEDSTLFPFLLLISYQFFSNCAGSFGTRSYHIKIFDRLQLPTNSSLLAFYASLAGLVGDFLNFAFLHFWGKRCLSLSSMMLCSLVSITTGMFIWDYNEVTMYILIALFIMSDFTSTLGISPLPWIMLGEFYPIKTRSIASGITAAAYCLISSLFIKTYPALQELLQMHFCFILYGLLGLVGFLNLYKFLPETEGKTPAEISAIFSQK